MRRIVTVAGIGALVLAGVAAPPGVSASSTPEDLEPYELTVLSPTATIELQQEVSPFAVSALAGYLDAEALTVETQNVDGSTAALQSLASGGGDIALAGAEATIAAVDSGVPVKVFGSLTVNFPYLLAVPADSDVTEAADLDGKRIGVISLASASYSFARGVVESAGLDADNDVEFVPLGGATTATTALEGGEVDALAYFTRAYATMENQGISLTYLENPAEFDKLFSVSLVTTDKMLEEHPDVLARYGRAVYQSLLFSAVNLPASVEMAYEYFPVLLGDGNEPADRIEGDIRTFGAYMLSALPIDGVSAQDRTNWGAIPEGLIDYVSTDYVWGLIEDDQLEAVIDFAITTGSIEEPIDIDEFWDPSLIDAMNDWDRAAVVEHASNWDA